MPFDEDSHLMLMDKLWQLLFQELAPDQGQRVSAAFQLAKRLKRMEDTRRALHERINKKTCRIIEANDGVLAFQPFDEIEVRAFLDAREILEQLGDGLVRHISDQDAVEYLRKGVANEIEVCAKEGGVTVEEWREFQTWFRPRCGAKTKAGHLCSMEVDDTPSSQPEFAKGFAEAHRKRLCHIHRRAAK